MKKLILLFFLFLVFQLSAQITVKTITEEFPGSGGVKLDKQGNVYIGNFGDGLQNSNGTQVWRLNKEGELKVFATGFTGASGNAFDSQGNFYQSNIGGGFVSKVTPTGTVSTFANNLISCPVGIAIDKADNLYVCNCCGQFGNTITKVTPAGATSQFASSNLLSCPNGITLDHEENLYVSNFSNGSIIKINPEGQSSFFASIPGLNNGHLDYSKVDSVFYVASHGSSRIYKLTLDKKLEVIAGSGIRGNLDGPAATATFSRPNGVAVSPSGDTLYINSSIPLSNVNFPLNPTVLRMVTGLQEDISTALNEITINNIEHFKIAPNPVQQDLNIQLIVKKAGKLQFILSDVLGRIIKSWDEKIISGAHNWHISTVDLPNGIYQLTISDAQTSQSRRFEKL